MIVLGSGDAPCCLMGTFSGYLANWLVKCVCVCGLVGVYDRLSGLGRLRSIKLEESMRSLNLPS